MPLTMLFKELKGTEGYVAIKGLGSRAAEVTSWTLQRRGDEGPDMGLLDLRAVFSFVVPGVLLDPDYNDGRELILRVGKSRTVRILLDDPERMALTGKVLTVKGVDAEWVSE